LAALGEGERCLRGRSAPPGRTWAEPPPSSIACAPTIRAWCRPCGGCWWRWGRRAAEGGLGGGLGFGRAAGFRAGLGRFGSPADSRRGAGLGPGRALFARAGAGEKF